MKRIIIFILSILIVSILLGCNSEPKYTAEEWEKIQEQERDAKTLEEEEKQKEEFYDTRLKIRDFFNKYYDFREKYLNESTKTNYEYNVKNVQRNINAIYDFKKNLSTLNVPEPLDDFYDKVIERANCNLDIQYYFKDSLTSNKIDESNYDSYSQKRDDLSIEIDREEREIRREYDLE